MRCTSFAKIGSISMLLTATILVEENQPVAFLTHETLSVLSRLGASMALSSVTCHVERRASAVTYGGELLPDTDILAAGRSHALELSPTAS